MMSARSVILLVSLMLAPALSASELSIVRVFPGWRSAASFKRISEYLTGRENTGGETILRTDPAQRAGYYFMVRLDTPGAPLKVQFKLQLVSPTSAVPQEIVFDGEATSGVTQLGLTGPEWQDAKSQPVAWHLQVLAANDGRLLAAEKSYLWDKPAAK